MLGNHRIAISMLVFLAVFLAGCSGGGGGGGNSTGSGLNGNVVGSINPTSTSGGSGSVTVTLDGSNITTLAGSDGSFSLSGVPAGVYTLVAQSGNLAANMVVVVGGGASTNIGEVDLVPSGQVAGIVTDSSTKDPIPHALVTVTDTTTDTSSTPPHPVRAARTDANGGYSIDGLPAGTYLVTISKAGYTSGTLDITITAGATTNGDISLTAAPVSAGTVSGTVTETNSDGSTSPLEGVFVALAPAASTVTPGAAPPTAIGPSNTTISIGSVPPYREYYAYTASDGTYTINGVPAGSYTAYALRPGFQKASQSATVTANQTTTVNFTLTLLAISTGTITGTVTDSTTSNPISGATVVAIIYGPTPGSGGGSTQPPAAIALPNVQSRFLLSTRTNSSGVYTLTVPTATTAIVCYASGYESQSQTVSVASGATDTVNISLTPIPTATLSGVVSEEASGSTALTPVAGATVSISTSPIAQAASAAPITPATYSTTTDAGGNYSITIPEGTYVVTAQSGSAQSVPALVKLTGNTTHDIVIQQGIATPQVKNAS